MIICVENMTCNNCVAKIQKALLVKGIMATFKLEERKVILKKATDEAKALEAIKAAGYEAKVCA